MTQDINTAALDHAWRYFELHSKQRIAVFNFFVVVSGAAFAGIGIALQQGPKLALLGGGIGVLLPAVAFLFWKLDCRASFLVKHAENAIVALEQCLPEAGRIVASESDVADKGEDRMWTFGRVFRATFLLVALIGLLLAFLAFAEACEWVALIPKTERSRPCARPATGADREYCPDQARISVGH